MLGRALSLVLKSIEMNIQLQRPLAVFDLEATGLDVINDRIVEIAILKIKPDGTQEEFLHRINPEMPIPAESSAIHGIFDADVADAPTLAQIKDELEVFLLGCDLVGFNSNKFDLPMLAEELLRVNSTIDLSGAKHIDVQNIFHKMEQRTLAAAYVFYCKKELTNAHSAMFDTKATWEVLEAQLDRYGELKNDVDFLSDFSNYGDVKRLDFAGRLAYNDKNEVVYNFGKHKGKTVLEVLSTEPGYYGWMMDADFPLYTKKCLKNEVERIKSDRRSKENDQSIEDKLEALKNKFKR